VAAIIDQLTLQVEGWIGSDPLYAIAAVLVVYIFIVFQRANAGFQ
jgi:hypothetical protein